MKWALDYKAAGKFQRVILEEHPEGWGAGGFTRLDGFGDALPTFQRLLATGRCPFIRFDLSWDDRHQYGNRYLRVVRREARRVKKVIQASPVNIDYYVNPITEHQETEKTWMKYAEIVEQELSNVPFRLVNVPLVGRGFVSKRYLNEYHGADKKPRGGRYAFSFDGTNCVDANVEAYKKAYKDAEYFMFWNCQMNGKKKQEEKSNRKDRRAYPISRQIDSWIYLHNDKGKTSLPRGWIFKSHADQHTDKPTGKDQMPIIITTPDVKPPFLELQADNGQVISRSSSPQPFNDKLTGKLLGWRYYFTDWGYLLAEKAIRIQGDPVCSLVSGNKSYGLINPAFRDGKWR